MRDSAEPIGCIRPEFDSRDREGQDEGDYNGTEDVPGEQDPGDRKTNEGNGDRTQRPPDALWQGRPALQHA
jgi:hypothetical protein